MHKHEKFRICEENIVTNTDQIPSRILPKTREYHIKTIKVQEILLIQSPTDNRPQTIAAWRDEVKATAMLHELVMGVTIPKTELLLKGEENKVDKTPLCDLGVRA